MSRVMDKSNVLFACKIFVDGIYVFNKNFILQLKSFIYLYLSTFEIKQYK